MKKPVLVTIDEKVLEDFKSAFPTTKRSPRIQELLEKELENDKMNKQDRAIANQCLQISARMDAIEEALAINVQKDVSPTPAPIEEQQPECPPGFKWDEATQKCIETQPAPAVQKATPDKLVKERRQRIAQSIY